MRCPKCQYPMVVELKKGETYKVVDCAMCGSTIDVSVFNPKPQLLVKSGKRRR